MASTQVNHKSTKDEKPAVRERTDKEAHNDDVELQNRKDLDERQKSAEHDRRPIREALKGKNVDLTFPSPDTWSISKGGKTDTGNVNMPIETIVSIADKM